MVEISGDMKLNLPDTVARTGDNLAKAPINEPIAGDSLIAAATNAPIATTIGPNPTLPVLMLREANVVRICSNAVLKKFRSLPTTATATV